MNFPKPLRRPGALILAASVAALLAPSTVRAASGTWGNTATDWNTNSSWSGSTPPGTAATDIATFNAATPAFQPNISTSVTTGRIVFGTGGWTLSSTDATKTLTLLGTGTTATTAALTNTGSNIISAPLIFGATGSAQMIRNNSSSTLNITGSITKSDSGELQFSNGSTTAISVSGNITAAGKFSTTGGAGITLSGSNSAGSWDIGSGGITLNSAGALGTSGTINWSNSGLLIFTANNNTDYSSRFTVSANQSYTVGAQSGVTVTFASALTGNGTGSGFNSGGSQTPGTIILGNAGNSFSGSVSVRGGAVSVAGIGNTGNNSYLGTSGTINLGASATAGTLVYTGAGETSNKVINLGGTTGGGAIQADNTSGVLKFTSNTTAAAGAKTLTLRGVGAGEFAGVISNGSGTVALTKSDAGTWTLSGTNTYSGATTVSAGILTFANTSAKSASSAVTAAAAGTVGLGVGGSGYYSATDVANLFNTNTLTGFTLNASSGVAIDTTNAGGSFDQTTALTAARALTKLGTGTLKLSGSNSYTGVTTASSGTLQFATTNALYGGTTANWTAAKINVKSGATLALNVGGSGEFTTGNVTTLLTNLAASSSGTNGMNAGSILGFDTTNASGGNFTIADTIADTTGATGGARGLTKNGTGNLTLTSANTYSGGTTVTSGKLEVNNTTGSGTGSGSVTVNSGATLAGEGFITTGSNNYIYLNGTLQVGSLAATQGTDFSITTSGTGSTIFGTGSSAFFDLWSTTGADQSSLLAAADLLRIFGDLTIGSASTLKLGNPNNLTFQNGDVFKLFDWTGLGSRTGTFSTIDSADLNLGSLTLDTSNLYTTGTISILGIPEPSRALLLMVGLTGATMRRRRGVA